MKKRLFFHLNFAKKFCTCISGRSLFLLLIVLLSIPFQLKASEQKPVQDQDQNPVTIYVSGEATIHGMSVVSYDKIVEIPKREKEKDTAPKVKKAKKTIILASVEKKSQVLNRTLEKIKENTESAQPLLFTSAPGESNFTKSTKGKVNAVSPSNDGYSFKVQSFLPIEILKLPKIEAQLEKQKFSTSLSYLQFRKFRSSSLRGPPVFI